MTPILLKNLGTNISTGLEEVLKVWAVNIDAEVECIYVRYKIYILSPTGVEVSNSGNLEYTRYNSETNTAFDKLRNSPIGQGIAQAIAQTLALYPNIEQVN